MLNMCTAQVVFNTKGEREEILAVAAKDMITVFESLLALLLEPGASSRAVSRCAHAISQIMLVIHGQKQFISAWANERACTNACKASFVLELIMSDWPML